MKYCIFYCNIQFFRLLYALDFLAITVYDIKFLEDIVWTHVKRNGPPSIIFHINRVVVWRCHLVQTWIFGDQQ